MQVAGCRVGAGGWGLEGAGCRVEGRNVCGAVRRRDAHPPQVLAYGDVLILRKVDRYKATWKREFKLPLHKAGQVTTMISGCRPVSCQYRTFFLWGVGYRDHSLDYEGMVNP